MKFAAIVCVLAFIGAAETPPPPPPPHDTVRVDVVAVHAFSENRGARVFDKELQPMKEALADLEYDTFQRLSAVTLEAAIDKEVTYQVNSRYKLCVRPLSREPSGQVRLSVRVEMRPSDQKAKPINAVSTTLLISPEKRLKVRGLKLDVGELVMVLMLKG